VVKRLSPHPSAKHSILSEVGCFARYLATGRLDRPDPVVESTDGRAAELVAPHAPAPAPASTGAV
jgi:hypothetical protein